MVSRADILRLCERSPTPGSPVLTVHLDVDQANAANLNRGFASGLRARLRALEKSLVAGERDALRADADRVERFVAGWEPRGAGLVLVADDSADLFWAGELRLPTATDVRWGPTPWVRPLLEALDEHPRHAIVVVDKERARVLSVFLGEVEEEREAIAAAETRHKNASGTDHWRSHMQFQRQDETHVRWHLAQVVELVEAVGRTNGGFQRLLLAGPVEATSELARLLPRALAERLVGTARLPADAPADEVLRRARPLMEEARREGQRRHVEHVLDRGAVGLEPTLRALQEGRLGTLAYAEGFASRGGECLRCGALFPEAPPEACGYCGGSLLPLDDLVGRAMARAAAAGAAVERVHGEHALRLLDAGGIGGVLRF